MKKFTLFIIAISYQLLVISFNVKAQVTDLWDFNDTTGITPYGAPIISGNVLYGTTQIGGENGYGTIFSIHIGGGGYKDLWDFDDTGSAGNANGRYPANALAISGSRLYGVTDKGGANNYGEVFSINTNGSGYKDLWDFDDTGSAGNANGAYPQCTLLLSGNKLFGMASHGGANGVGNIFSVNVNGGGYKDLWDFADTGSNGTYPNASLTLSGRKFYGMTGGGGVIGYGNVFSIDTDGANYGNLLSLDGDSGQTPMGDVTVSGSKIYGMTSAGGQEYGLGIIFSLDTNGKNFKVLTQFNGTTGSSPEGDLTLSGNLLYGMTNSGGLYGYKNHQDGYGVIFSIDTGGSGYADIFDFNNTYGANPVSNLALSGGILYGMAPMGGADSDGLVFSDNICNLLTSKVYSKATDSGNCFGVAAVTPAGGSTPYSYLWQGGQTTDTIWGQCAGTYACIITDDNGCTATASVTINSTATGINKLRAKSEELRVYPNPNNGIFTVSLSHAVSASQTTIEIYNTLGEQIYTSTPLPPNGGGVSFICQMNLSSQPDGVYLYRVITNNGGLIGEGKVIVQR